MEPMPTFEDAYSALAQTVAEMEQGGLTLDESLDRFQHGMALYRVCVQLLDSAELQVSRLLDDAELDVD